MSYLTMSAKLDEYVINNYAEPTKVALTDYPFNSDGLDYWSMLSFNAIDSVVLGTNPNSNVGSQELVGQYSVSCFAKYKNKSLDLVNDFKSLLDGKVVQNIWVEQGIPNPSVQLDDEIWYTTVNFRVSLA